MKSIILCSVSMLAWMALMPGSALSAQRSSSFDSGLKAKIYHALGQYYPDRLDVGVNGRGILSITGSVKSCYDKLRVYQIVGDVPGVKEIADLVNVHTPMELDSYIRNNIEWTIRTDPNILEPNNIAVEVNDGGVILRGTVDRERTKLEAAAIASSRPGVVCVVNKIQVRPKSKARSDGNIKRVIHEMLANQFPRLTSMVGVNVLHGEVILNGEVHNQWEIDHLRTAFLGVPGVKKVVEYLSMQQTI